MKTLKKNQIVVFVIGLMIITAGYLSFINNENEDSIEAGSLIDSEEMASIGDAKLVSANVLEGNSVEAYEESNYTEEIENVVDNEIDDTGAEIVDVETGAETITVDEYFTNSRLERNTMYSQQIENYQDILNNSNVSETQKKTAQDEITRINNEQNAIMIAENLIKTKGIGDLVIFKNGESINVIVKGDDLTKEEIAQIQNIITRELETDIDNIHIMNKE